MHYLRPDPVRGGVLLDDEFYTSIVLHTKPDSLKVVQRVAVPDQANPGRIHTVVEGGPHPPEYKDYSWKQLVELARAVPSWARLLTGPVVRIRFVEEVETQLNIYGIPYTEIINRLRRKNQTVRIYCRMIYAHRDAPPAGYLGWKFLKDLA